MSRLPADKLPFSLDEYQQRLDKTRKAMAAAGLDTLIVSDPSNMAWLTGYDGWSFYVHQAVIVGPDGEPFWFGRRQDANGAVRTVYMDHARVLSYDDIYVQNPDKHPMEVLVQHLADHGIAKGRIGVELDNYYYSAKAHATLVSGLAGATLVDATGLVNWQRAVKSAQELAYMRRAGKIVERMHRKVWELVEPGLPKSQLVAAIQAEAFKGAEDEAGTFGGDYAAIVPLLPSGSDAAAPHLTWDDQPFKTGEGTFYELGGCYKRYHCPLSRTVFLGKPSQTFLDAEKAVQEGLAAGLEKACAGNEVQEIAIALFDTLAKYGITKDNRTGYPIGISYPPDWGERTYSLRRGDTTVLQPGMTMHFMTGLWMDDWGFEITESLAITDGDAELFANLPRDLLVKD
jgi:ectoine hydrolase